MQSGLTSLLFGTSISLVCLGLAGCGGGEILPLATINDLDKGDDGLRLKFSGALYTGYLVEYYTGSGTNQLRSRSMIRDGKLNGLSEGWYAGGQLQVSETFIDGKSHGTRVKWYTNGAKEAEDSIEHGELNGPCRKWHDNGQLAEEMTMVSGQSDGQARSWHPDGSKKAEVRLEMGKMVEQEFWEQGKRPGESKSSEK